MALINARRNKGLAFKTSHVIKSRSVRGRLAEIPTVQVVKGVESAVDGATGSPQDGDADFRVSPFGHFFIINRRAFVRSAFHNSIPMPKNKAKISSQNSAVATSSTPGIPKLAFTREEAAQAIGVHPVTISRLTEKGLLRPSRATRRPIYSQEEIKRFLLETSSASFVADMQKSKRSEAAKE